MKVRGCGRLLFCAALLVGVVSVAGVTGVRRAAAAEEATGTGSNCVTAWSNSLGQFSTANTGASAGSGNAGSTWHFRMKCFYKPEISHTANGPEITPAMITAFGSEPVNGFHGFGNGDNCTGGTGATAQFASEISGWTMVEHLEDPYYLFEVAWTWTKPSSTGRALLPGIGKYQFSGSSGATSALFGAECSGSTVLTWSHMVAYEDFDASYPDVRWGDDIVPNACAQYSVTGPGGETTFTGGDTVTFTITFDGAADPVGLDVQFRPGDPWQPILLLDVLRSSGENVIESTVTVWPGGTVHLEDVLIRCIRDGFGPAYVVYGEDGWEATEAVSRPCVRARVFWPEWKVYEVDADMPFTVSMTGLPSGGDDEIVSVAYFTYDREAGGPGPYSAASWITVAGFPQSLPFEEDFVIEADYENTPEQVVLRCEDAEGYYYAKQWAAGFAYTQAGSKPNDGDCFDHAGLGVSPASWVPGLLRGMSCVGMYLFVPGEESVDEFVGEAEELSEHAPISFVTEAGEHVVSALSGLPSAVTAHRSDCISVLSGHEYIADQSMCPSAFGSRSEVASFRTWIGVIFWFTAAWGLWGQTRKLIAT